MQMKKLLTAFTMHFTRVVHDMAHTMAHAMPMLVHMLTLFFVYFLQSIVAPSAVSFIALIMMTLVKVLFTDASPVRFK